VGILDEKRGVFHRAFPKIDSIQAKSGKQEIIGYRAFTLIFLQIIPVNLSFHFKKT
jgi:hypothetical protein